MRQLNHVPTVVITVFLLVSLVPDHTLGQAGSDGASEGAHGTDQSRIAFGLSAGPHLAAFWGPDATDLGFFRATESRRTYILGVRARYRATQVWSIQARLHYAQGGQEYKGINAGQRYSSEVQLSYLQVPVLAQARLLATQIGGRPVSVRLSAGPYLSFLLEAKERITQPSDNRINDLNSITRPFSWGGQVGLGLSTPLSFGHVGIETRYNLGLRDINTSSVNVKNQGLTIALTFGVSI
jgi:hypothetical protein